MDLTCPTCGVVTSVPESHLPPEGTRGRCDSCSAVSVFYRGGLVADDPTPPGGTEAPVDPDATPPRGMPPDVSMMSAIPLAGPVPLPPGSVHVKPSGPAVSIGWQIRTAAGDKGPLPLEALKPLIRDGKLTKDDLACPPGRSEWLRAGEVPDLQRWFSLQKGVKSAPAPALDVAPCTKHPGVRGRWLCPSCGNLACDQCVISEEVIRVHVKKCPDCGKVCSEFVPSKKITPFWKDLKEVFTYPLRKGGILAMALCWVVGALSVLAGAGGAVSIYGRIGKWILTLAVYAYHLIIIRETGKGKRSVPNLGHIGDFYDEMFWPAFRALVVSIIVFLPSIVTYNFLLAPARAYVGLAEESARSATEQRVAWEKWKAEQARMTPEEQEARRRAEEEGDFFDPTASLLAGAGFADEDTPARGRERYWFDEDTDYAKLERDAQAGVGAAKSRARGMLVIHGAALTFSLFIWPIFLIVVALFNTVVPAFQPQVMFKLIGEIKEPYKYCALICAGCFLAIWLVDLPFAGTPIFNSWRGNPLTFYFSFVAFYVMGRTAEIADRELDMH